MVHGSRLKPHFGGLCSRLWVLNNPKWSTTSKGRLKSVILSFLEPMFHVEHFSSLHVLQELA